jgi:hypothetical protein
LDRGRPVGIAIATVYLERVDPILVHRLVVKKTHRGDRFIFIFTFFFMGERDVRVLDR